MSDHDQALSIGEVAEDTGLSRDTLRYYERIGLIGPVARDPAGRRRYSPAILSRLHFIRRAQKMDFSLDEIRDLLAMRSDPQHARDRVRRLTAEKLAEIERRIGELETLRDELTLLLNLCRASEDGCPIIEGIEQGTPGA